MSSPEYNTDSPISTNGNVSSVTSSPPSDEFEVESPTESSMEDDFDIDVDDNLDGIVDDLDEENNDKEEEEEEHVYRTPEEQQLDEDLKELLLTRMRLRKQIKVIQQQVEELEADMEEEMYYSCEGEAEDNQGESMDCDNDDELDLVLDEMEATDSQIVDEGDADDDDEGDDGDLSDSDEDELSRQGGDDGKEDESGEESGSGEEEEHITIDEYLSDEESEEEIFTAPTWCVPIKADVMRFDWESLGRETQFDVIVADPPWQLATQAPTRGVAIGYQQLPDICIEDLPIDKLQTNGFIFIWVINNKYAKAFELMEKWGYSYVDDITWVKQTINRRMAKGHGFYLQHAKETCLIGRKGVDPVNCRHAIGTDIIFAERRGQSQKPEQVYELIEKLVPNGKYLEIFGRKNNLRDYWVTVGNEL